MNTPNLKTKGWSLFLTMIFLITCISQVNSQESVIIRTDRDIYIAGESIWIQLNCVKSGTSQPSPISQVIYVELLNHQNIPVAQLKLKTIEKSVQTKITLPDSLSTGNYKLRAYTQWMRNYGETYFGRQIISVVSPFSLKSMPPKHERFVTDTLLAYAEGGLFLTNTPNKLLIHTVTKDGKGHSVSGNIVSHQKDTLQSVTTNEHGFALVYINPNSKDPLYFVYEKDSRTNTLPLPVLQNSGHNLQITKKQEGVIFFRIHTNTYQEDTNLSLLITTVEGKLISDNQVNLNEEIQVNLANLENPINCALLISDSGKVLSKRVFSKGNIRKIPHLQLSLEKENYHCRELVDLSIKNTSDTNYKDITVSISKKCLYNDFYQENCFQETSPRLNQLLGNYKQSNISDNDLLIMIQSNEQHTYTNHNNRHLPEIKGEIVTGVVTNPLDNHPIKNELMVLSFVGNESVFCLCQTDSSGYFKFEVNQFGEKEIVIQPFNNDTSRLNYKISLNDTYSNEYSTKACPKFVLSTDKAPLINEAIINMQINRVYENYHSPFIKRDSINPVVSFYGEPEIKTVIDKFIELPNVEEIMKEIVPSTALRKQKGQSKFIVFEKNSLYPSDGPTLTLVDGVPIHDIEMILHLTPEEIDRIEVVNLNYFIDGVKLGRLLCFYTRSGNMGSLSFESRIFRQARQCYEYHYKHTGPDYSSSQSKASNLPDFRNMLYYQTVDIPKHETKSISFYTSDESTEYTIVVEGIRDDGQIERVELPLIVKD